MAQSKPWNLTDRTFLFACDVVRLCRVLAREAGAPRQIAEQLLDAGTSVGANTEEARSAYSRREFAAKNAIVLKEAREARYWLRLIVATGLARREAIDPLIAESNELVKIFSATVKRARSPLCSTGAALR